MEGGYPEWERSKGDGSGRNKAYSLSRCISHCSTICIRWEGILALNGAKILEVRPALYVLPFESFRRLATVFSPWPFSRPRDMLEIHFVWDMIDGDKGRLPALHTTYSWKKKRKKHLKRSYGLCTLNVLGKLLRCIFP